jgi:hypothetical protein
VNLADLLTYADIQQLRRMQEHYGVEGDTHSKHDMICSLLRYLGRSSVLSVLVRGMEEEERRFLQLLCLDSREVYSMEDLLSKERMAWGKNEGKPRELVSKGLRSGWLFPGLTSDSRHLYRVPLDFRQRVMRVMAELKRQSLSGDQTEPTVYRDEQGLVQQDLNRFLSFVSQHIVQLTSDGAIYRQQQRQLLAQFTVREDPVMKKGYRFGFGRRYHQYPDRFSLIYDYAYYQGYIAEEIDGYLRLTETGAGKIVTKSPDETPEMIRFWIRLYRHQLPYLPVLIRWVDLLAGDRWISSSDLLVAMDGWVHDYYYETSEQLLHRLLKMMLHVGLVSLGETSGGGWLVRTTPLGRRFLKQGSGLGEQEIEEDFFRPSTTR